MKEIKKYKISNYILITINLISFVFVLYSTFHPMILNNTKIEGVVMKEDLVEQLNEKFETEKNEFIVCFNGEIRDKIVYINNFTTQKPYENSPSEITAGRCFGLGTIHSHPIQYIKEADLGYDNGTLVKKGKRSKSLSCELSNQDIKSMIINQELISGIICDLDTIYFVSYNEVSNRMLVITK